MVTTTVSLCALALLCLAVDGFVPGIRIWSRNGGQAATISTPHRFAESALVQADRPVSSVATDASSKLYARELKLLHQSLQSFNSSAAKSLVNELGAMRSNGTNPEEIDVLLDNLLTLGPDSSKLAFWTSLKPLSRCSKQCRMASLHRTLDMTTPPRPDDEELESDLQDLQLRRRRAFVSLLRQLAAEPEETNTFRSKLAKLTRVPAIRVIESKARRELRQSKSPLDQEELRSRMGQNLETPAYDIIVRANRNSGIEIRQYQPFTVCSVNTSSVILATSKDDTQPKASNTGSSFNTLAGYLFGKNQAQTPMKMTTPVLMDEQPDGYSRMSFVLPSDYWSRESLTKAPQPLPASGVSLNIQESQTRAVIMFGGYASKSETTKRKEQLMQALASGDWEVVPGSSMTLSQYNDPFTPPWKRLNEVSIQVQKFARE